MRIGKLIFINLIVLSGLLILIEASLWLVFPDYKYYYRTHPGQPDLNEILIKTDTGWLAPDSELGWVCQQKTALNFPTPPVDGISYQINAQGFRNAFDFNDSLPEHKKRILLIGDSFMFGIYLPEQKTISSQLQFAKGEDYLFFNLAVPAWGLDQMYLAYYQYVDLIKPDQVILAFIDEDLIRSLEILFHGCGRKPCLKIENNRLVNNEDNPQWWEYICWNNQLGNRLLRAYYERKAIGLAKFMLTDIVQRENELGRKPSFIRIPAQIDLQKKEARKTFNMVDFMKGQNVNYLELYDTLLIQNFNEYYIPDDGHFTEKGTELMSGYISKWIE
jgi:hypothetical protein